MEAVLKKVSIWHKLEEDRQKVEDDAAAAEGSQGIKSLSMEEQLAKKRQIFAPQEAYKMLAKELEKLMMEPIDGIAVDAVDNNVWHWDMYLSDFTTSTPIAQVKTSMSETMAHAPGTATAALPLSAARRSLHARFSSLHSRL